MTRYSRRAALRLMGAAAALSTSGAAFAQGPEGRKFIFVILRGGMDGLSALIPDDPELEALRGGILPDLGERIDLGNGFRLHPGLTELHGLYEGGEAAFVHAAATPYRARSHFDAQDVLETLGPGSARDGWLNRVLQAAGGKGLAVGYAMPLALKGVAPATNWSPPVFDAAPDDLLDRLADLYVSDPVFADPLAMARQTVVSDVETGRRGLGPAAQYETTLTAMGELMAADGGPGVGMASLNGWDTHANQKGALNQRLKGLDGGIAALKRALGPAWAKTFIVFCSEFGRTAAANGTRGADHGTGGLMVLAGGAVAGGKIHGDWPGLGARDLLDGRDLAPANDVTAVLKGVLREHLGVDGRALDQLVFPGSGAPLVGLVQT